MCTMILSFRVNGAKMTDKNPRPPDSPDNDFTNQWPPLEVSDYLNFDDDQWPDDDPDSFFLSQVLSHDNQTNEVGDYGRSGSHFEVEGSSSSKRSFLMKFILLYNSIQSN